MNDTFGMRLARLRSKNGMTQRDLGVTVGVSWSQISRYEAGKAKPRLPVLMKIADALGTTVEALTGDHSDDEGREVTVMLTSKENDEIEKFAKSAGLSFNDAIQKVMAMGLKMKYDKNPDMLAQLEADIPGAYEKLLKLLAKDQSE